MSHVYCTDPDCPCVNSAHFVRKVRALLVHLPHPRWDRKSPAWKAYREVHDLVKRTYRQKGAGRG